MKKILLFTTYLPLAILLVGCSSPFKPEPEVQRPLFNRFQKMSTEILESGGIAVVGIGESKSLNLALNRAKVHGRIELTQRLESKIETLRKNFVEEVGLTNNAQILAEFNDTLQTLSNQQIQSRTAKELKYETIDGTVTAYALMELNPEQVMNQLKKENELYPRFRSTSAFKTLNADIKKYEAFKKTQTNILMTQ